MSELKSAERNKRISEEVTIGQALTTSYTPSELRKLEGLTGQPYPDGAFKVMQSAIQKQVQQADDYKSRKFRKNK